jgi:hypothetical protein
MFLFSKISDKEMKEEESSSVSVSALLSNIQLDANAIKMNVKTGSKINNLMTYANKQFEVNETLTFLVQFQIVIRNIK